MRFEKVWIEQCKATKAIKRRFGAKSALDYLIGEKLTMFADAAKDDANFAKELPRFLAAIWQAVQSVRDHRLHHEPKASDAKDSSTASLPALKAGRFSRLATAILLDS